MAGVRIERLLVCGDRKWSNKRAIMRELKRVRPKMVIHGMARGADQLAGECAKDLGIKVLGFPAQWELFGRAAGPIRNRQMLEQGEPDHVMAFHAKIKESKGTADMLRIARAAGVGTTLIVR